ncbi:MAG TPA: PAS domain S-box protein [Candidatus Eisenbacteria bacterium]|nr:PAS domain S-box protein [Candidatus Eisenbacteria bacterium]
MSDRRSESRTTANAPTLWSRAGGPLVTLLTLAGIVALARTPWAVPTPAVVFLVPVVYSAFIGGLVPGLVSAGLGVAFAVLYFSDPGAPLQFSADNLERLIGVALATPAIAVMVGLLKRREQRRVAAQAAGRAGERYRELVEGIDGVVWEADTSAEPFRFTFVSPRAEQLLGYPASRWLEDPGFWPDCIHAGDRDRWLAFAREVAAGGSNTQIVYRAITADGHTVWLRDRMQTVPDARGMLRGVLFDITDQKLTEEGLRASETRKGAILEGALDCIVTIDHNGNVTDFNPAAERTFGYRRADVLGLPMGDLIVPPELRDAHRQGLRRFLETGEARVIGRRIELTAMRSDGSEFPVELTISRIPGAEPPVFTGFIRDITERRATEAELRGTLSLLSATLESTADGILVVDGAGKIVSLNRTFSDMWRIPESILAARDDQQAIAFVLSQLRHPEAFLAKVRELYAQPDAQSFDVLEFKDGRVFERYSTPQRIDGRSVGRVWSFRDVTERRHAEAALLESELQLRQSQKMDAIGRLAGGVAHDFNNLLTVILGYGEQILEHIKPHEPMRRPAEEIQSAAERAAALTRQLLAFSRKQMLEPRVLDLNATLSGTSRLLRRLIGEDIQFELKLDPLLGRVLADEPQIQQVVMNLAINARDAMPNGGQLTLTTSNADLDESFANRHHPVPAGAYVVIEVSDTGIGMDADTQARLFEPFFTTKERGKGTGLGLATVYGIVKQSGGYIWVYSESGKGTVFKVYLPRLLEPSETVVAATPAERLPGGTETVLLVEDEAQVRDLLRGMLERHGYHVLVARSGEEALAVAGGRVGALDLLITDVVMPGIGGPELAARLTLRHQGLRVLHISGYTDDAVLRLGVSEGVAAFLQKPFTIEALLVKVREVLDAKQPA